MTCLYVLISVLILQIVYPFAFFVKLKILEISSILSVFGILFSILFLFFSLFLIAAFYCTSFAYFFLTEKQIFLFRKYLKQLTIITFLTILLFAILFKTYLVFIAMVLMFLFMLYLFLKTKFILEFYEEISPLWDGNLNRNNFLWYLFIFLFFVGVFSFLVGSYISNLPLSIIIKRYIF
jgi:hypothetical protein